VDVGEEKRVVRRMAKKHGLSFPILLDKDTMVSYLYGVRSHPVAYLIDTNGDLIGVAFGYREWDSEEMISLVGSLLHKAGSPS
jgi:peroxiredoxin